MRSSKRGRTDETDGELCSKRRKRGGDSNAKLGESHFKGRRHGSEINMIPVMQPNNSTLAIGSRPTSEPVTRQIRIENAFKPTASKKAEARSRHYSAARKNTLLAKNVVLR